VRGETRTIAVRSQTQPLVSCGRRQPCSSALLYFKLDSIGLGWPQRQVFDALAGLRLAAILISSAKECALIFRIMLARCAHLFIQEAGDHQRHDFPLSTAI
jgi:hypothetical protein